MSNICFLNNGDGKSGYGWSIRGLKELYLSCIHIVNSKENMKSSVYKYVGYNMFAPTREEHKRLVAECKKNKHR